MTYSLRRVRDGAGDAGPMSCALWHNDEGAVEFEHAARPRVGVVMQVGSIYGRSYASQDYWQTTLITEITLDTPEEVHFKTGNSEYVWKIF